MEKTQLASQEVASANMAAESAAGALRRAEQAERVVQTEGAEHDRVSSQICASGCCVRWPGGHVRCQRLEPDRSWWKSLALSLRLSAWHFVSSAVHSYFQGHIQNHGLCCSCWPRLSVSVT